MRQLSKIEFHYNEKQIFFSLIKQFLNNFVKIKIYTKLNFKSISNLIRIRKKTNEKLLFVVITNISNIKLSFLNC